MRQHESRQGGDSVSTGSGTGALAERIAAAIDAAGGWIGFERYMAMALYEPGLGYYAHRSPKFGTLPASGSDFVTAPEMSPLFGRALARQVGQALQASGTHQVLEFGAGSGALAAQLIESLDRIEAPYAGDAPVCYTIVELSGVLRERQRERLARWGDRVRWLDALPERIEGVVVGNEVLDAMPVALLHWDGREWHERGVVRAAGGRFAWADRPTGRRPPVDRPLAPGTTTEIHPQAEAFVATLASVLERGAVLLIDYGFPQDEYYHPQRTGGTLMCHRGHRAEADDDAPLQGPGERDITAHVDFTAIALAGQEAGLDVIGYTSQARFLINCGIVPMMADAPPTVRIASQPLLQEHEMGELFKVIAFSRGCDFDPIGFAEGDRMHRL